MKARDTFRERLYIIIFGTDTVAGKRFDIALLWLIVLSTVAVMLESVKEIQSEYGDILLYAEYVFTALFTIEFIARLWTSRKPLGYLFSFYGIVDILSILPTYLSFFMVSSQYLRVIRVFRLMRVFRVLKLGRYMSEADSLWTSLKASRAKIGVFPLCCIQRCHNNGHHNVHRRRRRKWLYEHTKKYILGDRYDDHRRLWRHPSAYRVGAIPSCNTDDLGLWNNRRTNWYCWG